MEYDLFSLPYEISDNIYPILYTDQLPEYTNVSKDIMAVSETKNMSHLLTATFIKSIDWSYEKE